MTKVKRPTKGDTINVDLRPLESEPGEYRSVGGSRSDGFNMAVVNQAINASWRPEPGSELEAMTVQRVMATFQGIAPKDETEGLLAAQMVAVHNAAMECFRRAMLPDQMLPSREMNLRLGDKLSKTYAQQMETLKRYRKKAEQTVRVERVVVEDGGQAIVGTVTKGGGADEKSQHQPHAKAQIADAREPAMWCENPVGKTVSVASG